MADEIDISTDCQICLALADELTHTRQALESAGKEAGELAVVVKAARKFWESYWGSGTDIHRENQAKLFEVVTDYEQRHEEALRPSSARAGKTE
jgi:hypothetical protein